jgi:LacI family transcriptional regulator
MPSKTTLKQISEQLKLSVSTVSRALKNHPDIAEETKQRVRELADQLEYEPNAYAIGLRTNSSKIFGLIVPTISNWFYESVIAAVEKRAREEGYSLMILQSGNDPSMEAENLRLCRLNRVAGVLIAVVPGSGEEPFRKLGEAKIPVVFLDKVPEADQYNKVCMDDEGAARLAAGHILEKGRQHVLAIFGNPQMSITRKRKQAFADVIQKAGITLSMQDCPDTMSAKAITESVYKSKGFDTVFAMSDELLMGAMSALQELQIAIPRQVSVIAISNGFLPALYNPVITYVETSGAALGELAITRLMDYLNGKTFSRTLIVPVRLVEGKSVEDFKV